VVIGVLNNGASVRHGQNTVAALHSISASSPIALAQGTLRVTGTLSDSSAVSLAGGILQKATITSGTTLLASSSTSTLDDVTLAGLVHLASSFAGAGTVQVTTPRKRAPA
jgi:hypothetical protein